MKHALFNCDQLLAMIATPWRHTVILRGRGIVGKVVSNLGLQHMCPSTGIELSRSGVGPKSVLTGNGNTPCVLGMGGWGNLATGL